MRILIVFLLLSFGARAQCGEGVVWESLLERVGTGGVGIGNACGEDRYIVAEVYSDVVLEGLLSISYAEVIIYGDTIHSGGRVLLNCSASKLTVLGTLGIDENKKSIFTLYPNPVSDALYVTGKEIDKIEIYNLIGAKVIETPRTDNMIDVSFLSPGMYIIRVTNILGNNESKKIIIK